VAGPADCAFHKVVLDLIGGLENTLIDIEFDALFG
jgi:hypothetical protein